jgi:single-stranded-DNA-specific exonuclease
MSNSSASWQIPQPVEVLPEILQAARGNLLLAQSLMRKGMTKPDIVRSFLDPNYYRPSPPSELPNLPKGVERISQAIRSGEKIGVWGDFDADGLTATSLLVSGLRSLGARISFHVPVRSTESHGVSLSSLKKFLDGGIQLLLTCDTGISAIDAVAYANLRGVDTIITDHHTPPPVLPAAHAIINPHLLPHPHPLENLCGVGCAYKLIEDLFGKLAPSLNPAIFHDLVAIGTIADLALLTDDNRFLVQKGLTELRANPRLAILAMLDRAEISHNLLTEEHVSFWIAPQLNAIGRLDDANPVIEFLLTQDPEHAELFASRLKAMNDRRKMIGDQVFKAAQSQIEKDRSLLDTPALILHHPDWPSGVIGIVANRLVAQYRRPVIMLTGKPGEDIRGSARSVEGLDITKKISSQQALLQGFGGHSMAAGFSLPYEKLSEFRRSIQQILEQNPVVKQPSTTLQMDAILPLQEITLELVETLDILAPYGPGNKPLTFICQNLTLLSHTPIGKNRDHLQFNCRRSKWHNSKSALVAGCRIPIARREYGYGIYRPRE